MIDLVRPSQLATVWPDTIKQIRRAAKYDTAFDENALLRKLVLNEYQLWKTEFGFVVTGIRKPKGKPRRIFRIIYAAGSILGATQAPFSYVRQIMRIFEQTALTGEFKGATAPKCKEIRLEGRKGWAKVLPDYQKRQLSNGNFEFYRGL